jgi:hypothetical protein
VDLAQPEGVDGGRGGVGLADDDDVLVDHHDRVPDPLPLQEFDTERNFLQNLVKNKIITQLRN